METVLIVDDQPLVGRSLAHLVGNAGRRAFYAQSAEEIAGYLSREGESVVAAVVDHDMPGVDLVGLLAEMRERAPWMHLVGSSAVDRRAEFAALGVPSYLPKPWRPADLFALLRSPLSRAVAAGPCAPHLLR